MSTHLIVGGSGFIGRAVTRELLNRGERVIVGVRSGSSVAASPGVPVRVVDVQAVDWRKALQDVDVVHYYAWTSIPETATADPAKDIQENLEPLLNLIAALRDERGRRVIFSSSGGTVYGEGGQLPLHEDHPTRPINAYGAAKLAAEGYLRALHASGAADVRIARLSNPYGAGQDTRGRQGAVSVFIRRALARSPVTLWGDGGVVRDYLHVSDAARALMELSTRPSLSADMPVVNVGSGVGHSLIDVIAVIERALGRPLKIERQPARPFDVPANVLDITRAAALLDWAPRLSLEQGVRRTIDELCAAHA